tara:strand:+ start:5336 stop:6559 length:1224 start_codon:yes stop_codon:yes gene_type:complete
MFDILGFTSILLVSLITLLIALRWPEISRILFVALTVRFLFLIINNYFFYLPDGDMDAKNFEQFAWDFSQGGFYNIFKHHYVGPDAYFISVLIAIPYSLFGRSILLAQSFSIFFGIGSVFLGWLLAKKLWNNYVAMKVGWVIALFPSLISYSVLTMREVYISFFLLVALYGIVNWVKIRSYKSISIVVAGFIGATFFHGASIIGLFVFSFIYVLDTFKVSFTLIKNKILSFKFVLIVILSSVFLVSYVSNKIYIPYLGTFEQTISTQKIKILINSNTKGGASYPKWLKVDANIEFLYKAPIRSLYFLFSPFPWEVKKLSHLVGVLDSFLYMILVYLIFCNRKAIWKDPALRIILIILVCYFIVFGIGVSNFGTGIRHRTKFVIGLILLAGPLIPKLVFSKKLKKKFR